LQPMTTTIPESPEVLKALVDNHRRFLDFLEKRVGSREEAEDILQDGFAKALRRVDALSEVESVIPWFYRLLRNAVIDHYRHRGAEARAVELAAAREETTTEMDDPDLRETVCGCVMSLVETLKPEYATALKEVELNEIPLSDFARGAGISNGNAAVRVHRAREALRKQVVRSCGTCADHGCEGCRCKTVD
jgi:RNA polymerase sigma factor (sigma-70 family)